MEEVEEENEVQKWREKWKDWRLKMEEIETENEVQK